jgi:two-component system sensor histidine kinase ChvG
VHRALRTLGRIRVRLLAVNLIVLLVPVVGLEFARIHEQQLLGSLERDMQNQASLVRALVESDLGRDIPLGAPSQVGILTTAAKSTRTRIRLLDREGTVVADSHANGPPEGPEPPPPSMLPGSDIVELRRRRLPASTPDSLADAGPDSTTATERWPGVPDRTEVKEALAGRRGAHTRIRAREPAVLLFMAEPIRHEGRPAGAVYVVRSTRPALIELYRIRSGLIRVLAVAILFTALVTLLLAWSISLPLGKLSRAAKRVAGGERDVVIPTGGGGEIRELGESFAAMKQRLDARLRYISDFAADVAHEFKSPLTSIRGAAELLDEGAADDPDARRRFLRNIELDVARLDRLVSRLLELSRIEASAEPMGVVDLEALLHQVADRASLPDQPIEVRCALTQRFVRARGADLETALINLLDNAVRFSPAGSPVILTAEGGPPALVYRIFVKDSGPGIPESNLDRIFDRFFTTDADRDGTGLGLSIVRSVVEAHGGRVTVKSPPGEGATFTIELPAGRM